MYQSKIQNILLWILKLILRIHQNINYKDVLWTLQNIAIRNHDKISTFRRALQKHAEEIAGSSWYYIILLALWEGTLLLNSKMIPVFYTLVIVFPTWQGTRGRILQICASCLSGLIHAVLCGTTTFHILRGDIPLPTPLWIMKIQFLWYLDCSQLVR